MPLPRTGKVVYIASLFTWAAVLRGSERSICPPPPPEKAKHQSSGLFLGLQFSSIEANRVELQSQKHKDRCGRKQPYFSNPGQPFKDVESHKSSSLVQSCLPFLDGWQV